MPISTGSECCGTGGIEVDEMSKHTEQSIRTEVRAWLKANWDPGTGLVEWRNKLVDSNWGMPGWPKEWYGMGLSSELGRAVEEECSAGGAIGVARTGIRTLAAATLLDHGTQFQKEKFLRRILTGEDTWCQLFSEPGSGSDLAGASTRADLKDGKWIINGQKVWTSSAHHAEWGLLLARTDWGVPKHKGLTYFLIDSSLIFQLIEEPLFAFAHYIFVHKPQDLEDCFS